MNMLQAALLAVFPALVIVAALSDLTTFTIPNRISLLLVAAFVPACLAMARPIGAVGADVAVGVAALVAAMGMFAVGWIGGGDAKLFAASALWLGLGGMPMFLLVTALAGGGLAVLLVNARRPWLRSHLVAAPSWVGRLTTPGEPAPYGAAIAAGALAAYPHSDLVQAMHGIF